MFVHNSEHNSPINSDQDDDIHDSITRISKLDISDPLHLHPNDTTALIVVSIKLKGTETYQYDAMIEFPKCLCNASEGFKKHNQLLKLMQFLMGLDDSYMQIRSTILSREVLPDVRSAYAIISSEESHRVVVGSIADVNHLNFFDIEYSEISNDDERVANNLNKGKSESSSSSESGNNINTVDFLVDFGYDPDSSVKNVRRSSRQSVFPRNYNDFVVESKVKYGLEKYAPRQWNAKLTFTLIENGFSQSKSDYSLYTKSDKGVFLALLVYVDDIIITGNRIYEIGKFKVFLKSKFMIKDLVSLHCGSKSTIKIAANPVFHERAKHLEIDLHFVREKISKGVVKTVKVDFANQIADILAK
uniref:Ribonuclease H-like domain-containing protein n=1 Tax=Tanacetum cinerariifolium TaxID=118510 RepID=A0A6L2JUD2_TANCI|nr:ribonuclease H-like domain-containing protein [Tanacetum cinerariifolium]